MEIGRILFGILIVILSLHDIMTTARSSNDGNDFNTEALLRNLLRMRERPRSRPTTPETEGFPEVTRPEGLERTRARGQSPSINLNIIVVPVLHEAATSETEKVGKQPQEAMPSLGNRLGFPTTNEEDDLDTEESSNFITAAASSSQSQTPAPGILPVTPPTCRPGQVYDPQLGQCIRRGSGTRNCPLCTGGRRRHIG